MFESLTNSLNAVIKKLKSSTVISESDFDSAMREIRISLLEADVALPIAKDFIKKIKNNIVGESNKTKIPSSKVIVKMVQDNLIEILGSTKSELHTSSSPTIIMLVGLQGSGKTTTAAKLALKLKKNKRVLLASLDVYRPAAQKQLEILGTQIDVVTLPIIKNQKPVEITQRSLKVLSEEKYDILILDTAGRLHIDRDMMDELITIKKLASPIETLLIADSMTGQDAVNIAKNFNDNLSITGIVLTRIDGDSRGGAALSMKMTANCPIKFIATGEKLSDFEDFHPDRIAQRILDKGDIVSLVEKATEVMGQEGIEDLKQKVKKGNFDLNDLATQLKTLNKLGGLSSIMKFIPNFGNNIQQKLGEDILDDSKTTKFLAIINSMTKKERIYPKILNGARKIRIAKGAGVKVQDVNSLLKKYAKLNSLISRFKNIDHNKIKKSDIMNILKSESI